MEEAVKKTNWTQSISYIVIMILITETVFLIKQNKELKTTIKEMTASSIIEPLQPGERVEPVKIQSLDKKISELTYNEPQKKTLLFIFSTTCPHCEKNLPMWKSLVEHNNSNQCDVIGISIHQVDKTFDYVSSRNVNFITYSVSSDTSFSRKYKISGVPETVLLNGLGIVEKTWSGELTQEHTMEIQKLMSTSQAVSN
jgi:peroxiredoxin